MAEGPISDKDIDTQIRSLGVISLIIALALKSNENGDKEGSWEAMKEASLLGHILGCKAFNLLYNAAATHLAWSQERNEYYYQGLFKKHATRIVPNSKVVTRKTNGHDIPDAWLSVDGDISPVEVKYNGFDKKALDQLLRYIWAYKANGGIAVARELKVDLPDNVRFVPLAELEKLEKSKTSNESYKMMGKEVTEDASEAKDAGGPTARAVFRDVSVWQGRHRTEGP